MLQGVGISRVEVGVGRRSYFVIRVVVLIFSSRIKLATELYSVLLGMFTSRSTAGPLDAGWTAAHDTRRVSTSTVLMAAVLVLSQTAPDVRATDQSGRTRPRKPPLVRSFSPDHSLGDRELRANSSLLSARSTHREAQLLCLCGPAVVLFSEARIHDGACHAMLPDITSNSRQQF